MKYYLKENDLFCLSVDEHNKAITRKLQCQYNYSVNVFSMHKNMKIHFNFIGMRLYIRLIFKIYFYDFRYAKLLFSNGLFLEQLL